MSKSFENEWQIEFEYKDEYGKNSLEVAEVSGEFEFTSENSNGDKVTLYLDKEEVKQLINFLRSKI